MEQETTKGGWRSAIYIIGVEVAERFAFYGASGNLITYLTNVLHEPTATAAKNVNIWSGVATLLPLVGAFIADSYLGRFRMILIASLIYIVGLIMLMLSVSVIPLRMQHTFFFLSLYLVAFGEGGHKPCVQTFGADQFDENNPEEKKAKSSFFNWWYFGICAGASAAILVVIYVQDNVSWLVGFLIPALAMALALVLFLFGKGKYRREAPIGSPFVGIVQVFVAAIRKRHLSLPKDKDVEHSEPGEVGLEACQGRNQTLTRTDQFKCLDKATIVDEIDSQSKTRNNWRLCSVTQVEEVKLLVRLVPIWLSCLTYAVNIAQIGTFFTKQGSTMDRNIGHNFHIPAASLQIVIGLVVMITIPIYDRILVPAARNLTGRPSGITMLQRIGIGMLFSILAMAVAALVETRRVKIATKHGLLDHPKTIVPMSVYWLLPQYVITGVSDVFTIVGLQELFYSQMPEAMRSVGSAVYLSAMGVGSLLSSVVITAAHNVSLRAGNGWLGDNLNRAHLDYYYWLLAGLSSLGLCVFIGVSMFFMYKKVDGDDEDDDHKQ